MMATSRRIAAFLLTLGLMAVVAAPADADVVTINASSDAVLSDTTGSGVFNAVDRLDLATHGLYVSQFENGQAGSFEDRAVMVFNLAALANASQITSLTFTFQETAFANAVGTVSVNGFSSAGTIGLADATAAGAQLGTYDALVPGNGVQTVTLTGAYLQSLLGSSTYFGLRLDGTQYGVNTSLGSVEQAAFFATPSITVGFTSVPEPASLTLLGLGLVAAVGVARRRLRAA